MDRNEVMSATSDELILLVKQAEYVRKLKINDYKKALIDVFASKDQD